MDNRLNSLDDFDSPDTSNDHLVDLRQAINVEELVRGNDIELDIDPKSINTYEAEKTYFDQEDVFHELNMECLDGDDDADEEDPCNEGMSPFEKMAKTMVDISPAKDNGILKKVLKQGTGSVIPPNFNVKVHYNGYFEYSDEPFDSSRLRGKPLSFQLGQGQTIQAWDIGIATMKKGELARFLADYPYAYGAMGCPPRIPQKAKAMFEIELIGYSDPSTDATWDQQSEEGAKKIQFSVLLERAVVSREAGNDAFQEKRTMVALKHYLKGLSTLEHANLKDQAEENQMKCACASLCLNISQCYLLNKDAAKAAKFSRKALGFDPSSVKGHYRLGKALKLLGDFEESRRQLLIAQRKLPGNQEISNELRDLNEKAKKFRALESETFAKMLSLNTPTDRKPEKKDTKDQVSAEMMTLTQERIKMFVADESLKELPLQLQLTNSELILVKELAGKYSVEFYEDMQGKQVTYKLRKR